MKKILALILAVTMCLVLAAACSVETGSEGTPPPATGGSNQGDGNQGGEGGSSEKSARQLLVESYGLEWEGEPTDITFTVFIGGTGKPPAPGNPVVELIYQLTGVRLEYEFEVREAEARVGTMVASGDYPDFISGSASSVRTMLVEAGSFIPLDDLLPNYPRLWAHYEDYLDRLRSVSPDNTIRILDVWGRSYDLDDGLDSQHADEYNGPAWWIQKAVIEFNDYVAPTTLEEYFDLLARYYAAYPEIDGQPTLPFEVYAFSDSNYVMQNPPQHLVGMRNEGDAVVLSTDPFEVEIYQNKWYAKEYYRVLNQAYKDGLINPATFTRIKDEYDSVISQGRVLGFFEQQWAFGTPEGVLVADGKVERTYVPMGLTLPGYESGLYTKGAGLQGGNGVGITQSCQDPARALKFMDQLMQPEVQVLLNWGIKDEHFYVDENGRFRRTEDQKNNWDNNDWRNENAGKILGDLFPKIQGRYPSSYAYGNAWDSGSQPEEKEQNAHPYDVEFYSHFPFSRRDGFLNYVDHPGYPELWSVREKIKTGDSEFNEIFNQIQEIGERYLPDVIQADDFEAAWESYVVRFDAVDVAQFERKLAERAYEERYW